MQSQTIHERYADMLIELVNWFCDDAYGETFHNNIDLH